MSMIEESPLEQELRIMKNKVDTAHQKIDSLTKEMKEQEENTRYIKVKLIEHNKVMQEQQDRLCILEADNRELKDVNRYLLPLVEDLNTKIEILGKATHDNIAINQNLQTKTTEHDNVLAKLESTRYDMADAVSFALNTSPNAKEDAFEDSIANLVLKLEEFKDDINRNIEGWMDELSIKIAEVAEGIKESTLDIKVEVEENSRAIEAIQEDNSMTDECLRDLSNSIESTEELVFKSEGRIADLEATTDAHNTFINDIEEAVEEIKSRTLLKKVRL